MEFDISTILTAVLGSGWCISELFHWRSNRARINAETKKTNADSDATNAESMSKIVDQLQEQEDKYIALLDAKDKKIGSLLSDQTKLKSESTSMGVVMCVHMACPLRRPLQGQGKSWYEAHKEQADLGVDYTPINILLKEYGAKKKAALQEIKEETNEKN